MSPPDNLPAPPEIPEHTLLRRIGHGSYGDVWLARNALDHLRAVKIIYRDRFEDARPYERELAGLRHFEPLARRSEHLVHLFQFGQNEGYFYYVMELADDASGLSASNAEAYRPLTLKHRLLDGPLPLDKALEAACALAAALAFLHEQRLIHRDVKPANVIFVNGRSKLADIGLVTRTDASVSLVGTHGYIPREGPGRPSADVYAFGKLLYEMATGKDRGEFPEIELEDIMTPASSALNALFLRACSLEPESRPSAAELLAELEAVRDALQNGNPIPLRRRARSRIWVATAGVVAVVIAICVFQSQKPQATGSVPAPIEPNSAQSHPLPASLNQSLVAYYPLDGDARDMSGQGNHGFPDETITYEAGVRGRAAFFDGRSVIMLPHQRLLDGAEEATVAAWVKRISPNHPRIRPNHRPANGGGAILFAGDMRMAMDPLILTLHFRDHHWEGWFADTSTTNPTAIARTRAGINAIDQWQHVAVVLRKQGDMGRSAIFVDGIKIMETPDQPRLRVRYDRDMEVIIGGLQPFSNMSLFWEGLLDEIRVYNRALTPDELATLAALPVRSTPSKPITKR